MVFKCDARTKYSLSSFVTDGASEVRLTNDERRQLLTMFDVKSQRQTGIMLLLCSAFAFVIGIVFIAFSNLENFAFGILLSNLLPGIVLLVLGIFMISSAPDMEKCVIKAYEFTITEMKHIYCDKALKYEDDYIMEYISEVTAEEAVSKYGITKPIVGDSIFYLHLKLNENWVEPKNKESFGPIRYGIKIGDKVRCAVLEYGEYCYVSLY